MLVNPTTEGRDYFSAAPRMVVRRGGRLSRATTLISIFSKTDCYRGKHFIAALKPTLDGIRIARLHWVSR